MKRGRKSVYYVEFEGGVWSIAEYAYVQYLRDKVESFNRTEPVRVDIDRYGEQLAGFYKTRTPSGARTIPARFAKHSFISPLDWTQDEWQAELERARELIAEKNKESAT